MIYDCSLVYDISRDGYWLYRGSRRLFLRGLVSSINGLLDERPLADLPSFERNGIEEGHSDRPA